MKLAIIGSREFQDYNFFMSSISSFFAASEIELIVSGGAAGADTLAIEWAKRMNIPFLVYNAEWENLEADPCLVKEKNGRKYNALAGFNRNKKIVDAADIVVAFWNGTSSGTKDSLAYAKKQKKTTIIFYVCQSRHS